MCSYVCAEDADGYQKSLDFMIAGGQMNYVNKTAQGFLIYGKYLTVSTVAVIICVAINSGAD